MSPNQPNRQPGQQEKTQPDVRAGQEQNKFGQQTKPGQQTRRPEGEENEEAGSDRESSMKSGSCGTDKSNH